MIRTLFGVAVPLLSALAACSNESANVQGAFIEECIYNGNGLERCECAFDFASDVFSNEQLEFYRAVTFINEKDLAKYKAQLGLSKAASLITRVALVEGDIASACGRLVSSPGFSQQDSDPVQDSDGSALDPTLVARLRANEAEIRNAATAIEISAAVMDLVDVLVAITDVRQANELLALFDEGPMSIEARRVLLEESGQLAKAMTSILANRLATSWIDKHVEGTRGEKDTLKSVSSITIAAMTGGVFGVTYAAAVETAVSYLGLSGDARAYMTSEVDRAYRTVAYMGRIGSDGIDVAFIKREIAELDEAAKHADAVSADWPQFSFAAVVLRSLGPILETKLQQEISAAPNSRSSVQNAYEAFAHAHLKCEALTPIPTTKLKLILDEFAMEIGVEGWRPTTGASAVGLATRFDSCRR